MGQMKMYMEN